MAKDKKVNNKSKERDLSNKDRFEILLEDMRHEFKAVGEGHGILLAKIEEGNRKSKESGNNLEEMIKFSNKVLHEKIDKIDTKLDKVIAGQNNQDKRINAQDVKLDGVYNKVFSEGASF
ncbi:MAG: hypothetical protein ABII25_03020 [bacterium]